MTAQTIGSYQELTSGLGSYPERIEVTVKALSGFCSMGRGRGNAMTVRPRTVESSSPIRTTRCDCGRLTGTMARCVGTVFSSMMDEEE